MILEVRTICLDWDWLRGGWVILDTSPLCFKDAPWYEPRYFESSYITIPADRKQS